MTPSGSWRAGLVYFAAVFGFAFLTGIARTLVLAPAIGATMAVIVEVPLILVVSWVAARWVVARYALETSSDRAVAGGIAFVLLMDSEMVLAAALSGESPRQWAASLIAVPGMIGFAGQILFALMPLVVARRT